MWAMRKMPENAPFEDVLLMRDKVVRSYGGDPRDTRQRLDNLAKYGKNQL
jgi:hypothetical protein